MSGCCESNTPQAKIIEEIKGHHVSIVVKGIHIKLSWVILIFVYLSGLMIILLCENFFLFHLYKLLFFRSRFHELINVLVPSDSAVTVLKGVFIMLYAWQFFLFYLHNFSESVGIKTSAIKIGFYSRRCCLHW